MRRLRVLTWHIHGNYLWYLSQADVDFFLPVRDGSGLGYGGRGRTFPFGPNVHDVAAEDVAGMEFDCILYQHRDNYVIDRLSLLSDSQQLLPSIYLEHDPPQEHPTGQRHWVDDRRILLVHVTPFNRLMWDCGSTPTTVIEHGVIAPQAEYSGELDRGIVVVNHLQSRGRRLGADIFEYVRRHVPLDLVGMAAEDMGGIGEIAPPELGSFVGRYRFFFNPIRYTSLGLAVCEAMSIGMPIVGLATTEMATAVQNEVTGFIDTDVDALIRQMHRLLDNPELARELGERARAYAQQRFDIGRFAKEWECTFEHVVRAASSPYDAGVAVAT